MVRAVLVNGLERGYNPRKTALDLVGRMNMATGRREGGLIGLTTRQAEWVSNAGTELDALDRSYFNRILRDKRYDSMVSKAMRNGKPLSAADRGMILGRYSDRMLKYRADTIARTETITALRAGQREGYDQLIDSGRVQDHQIERTWDATGDDRTRPDHMAMNGQTVAGMATPFIAPDGSQLMYPGDTSLGASDEQVIQCRCIEAVSIQDVIAAAQTPVAKGGNMPVDTGFLRNSLVSGLNGGFENAGPDAYAVTIAQMDSGDVARFGWTAEYAEHQEYGTSKMTGRHFAGSAVARWQEFVNRNVAKVK
jgi:hypothetical protein